MFAREQQRDDPERQRRVRAQRHALEIRRIIQRISQPRQNNSSTIGTTATARNVRSAQHRGCPRRRGSATGLRADPTRALWNSQNWR